MDYSNIFGNIKCIDGGKIIISLNEDIKNSDSIIDKYVVISDDKNYIGEVNSINEQEVVVFLLGIIENKKFIYGDLEKPSFKAKTRLITNEELGYIFNDVNNELEIGNSFLYPDLKIKLDANNFFSNHFTIMGNTGSGKSYAVAKLLQTIFYQEQKVAYQSNFFIFDAYGEYKNVFDNMNSKSNLLKYKLYTTDLNSNEEHLNLPFYLLDTDDIAILLEAEDRKQLAIINKAIKLAGVFASDEEKVLEYKNDIIARCLLNIIYNNDNLKIRTQIVSVLSKYNTKDINLETKLSNGGWIKTFKQCLYIEESGKLHDIEIICRFLESFVREKMDDNIAFNNYYSIDNFYEAVEFSLMSEGILSSDRVFDYGNILKVRLDALIKNNYKAYFDTTATFSKQDYIVNLLLKDSRKCQIVNFNINYVDDRFAKAIVKILSRWLFTFATSLPRKGSFPIHIILEEAHRYVQNDDDTKLLGYNIFDRITKEGRKYGVILGLISQRPSELSSTSISQCSNFLIFKMFYPEDLRFISSILPDFANYNIDRLKMLYPGVCIVTGNSFKLPTIVKIIKPNPEPISSNVDIENIWYTQK